GLQGGLTGSLFREFAFTLAGAVLISGVVALTLSPVMSAYLLPADGEKRGLSLRIDRGFSRLRALYRRTLDGALTARPAIYVLWIGLSILAGLMYFQSPRELAPTEDQGVVFGILETPANSTLELTSAGASAANDIFFSLEDASYSFQITNPGGGFGGVVLKSWEERDRTVFDIQNELSARLSQLASIDLVPIVPSPLPGGGQFPVEFVLASTAEPQQLLEIAQQLQQKATMSGLFAFPPLIDTKIDQPLTEVVLDRDKIASMGLDLQTIGADLSAMVGGNFVNRFNIQGRSYKVIPQIKRLDRLNPEQLQSIYVTGPAGDLISLSTVAHLERRVQPRSLNRFQQLNAVTISGVSIKPLDEALTFLEDEATRLMPQGYLIDYTGESRQLRTQGNSFIWTIMLAFILIYLVLAAQFNSFRDPFVILAGSVPLAMFGALLLTFLKMPNAQQPFWTDGWTTTMNIYSQVGLVTLIGLVSKNGILIVEFANVLQRQGKSKLEAVREAAVVRLRPVLMTSTATVLGHFPLTLVTGAGAEARNSIGLVLVSGMAVGTLFTLFVVPAIYVFFAANHSKSL
ncbi:MAG: efflux RND transporter permease subunit, partial [Acidobacteriota bacterium]|nr:efflux RND transporter permease subunit [Acidobacteriota bacterium]